MDDAFKTKRVKNLNVETQLLFTPSCQNIWLRAWLDDQ